jgi:CelD/BcsL family acetyltransferase involved in cellulose biosynthesis
MGDYRISIIDSFAQWEALRTEWNTLLGQSAMPNIFLSWEWLYSWAECFLDDKKKLFIPVIYEGKEIIAIAPWYINSTKTGSLKARQIDFIGTPEAGSDYLDVLIKKGKEKETAGLLYNFLFSDTASQWDRLRLFDIPSNSLFLLHLLAKIRETGKYAVIQEASYCPVASLPKTEEEFFSRLSSRRGQRFRQDLRALNKQNGINHLTFSEERLGVVLKDFFLLYTEKAGWPDNGLHRLIGKVVDRGTRVQIDFLATSERYIGGLLHLRYQNTLYMYLMAIDKGYNSKVSIGNLLVGLCIGNAIKSGISFYDFLKGIEDYKFHWANHGKSSNSVQLFHRSPVPVCLALTDMAKSAAKLILR